MKRSKGFTLIEMLVVLGIIGIVMSALLVGYGHMTKTAQKARAQELVSNVATALNVILTKNGVWPSVLVSYQGKDGPNMGCVPQVLGTLSGGGFSVNASGLDKLGIVSPWAQDVIKHRAAGQPAQLSTRVPTGGTIQDHMIYFAVDKNLDGVTEASVCGEKVKVRANAIAWCAGADGKLGHSYRKHEKANADNVYSWRRNQEVTDR